jgi:hypothetical protein
VTIETSMPSWLTREIDAKMFRALQEIERQESKTMQRLCELISKRGAFFPPHPGPLRPSLQRTPENPWANCQLIALEEDDGWLDELWWYCEGFVYLGERERYEHHAWLVDRHGVVTDPSLPEAGDPELLSYIGVVIEHNFLECIDIDSETDNGFTIWEPINWLKVIDVKEHVHDPEWSVDEVVGPVSDFGRVIPLRRGPTFSDYSHW